MSSSKTERAAEGRPNLYLLGFMATGKTVLGRRAAKALGYRFIDADAQIEREQGMKISEIFEKYGEGRFRELERLFMEGGHPAEGCVVSGGGGLCCSEGMPELIKSKGVAVVLFSKEDEILERASLNGKRPLLKTENPREKIREMMEERRPYYMKSGVAIATSPEISQTLEHILRVYNKQKRLFLKDAKKGDAGK